MFDLNDTDLLIVDGANTLWRSCYANAGLGYKTDAGFQPTGGVYGFFESILSVLAKLPDGVQVWITWEGQRSRSSRREVLPTYKKREPDPKRERLAQLVGVQAAILRGCLDHTSFLQATSRDWEGDDAMATITQAAIVDGANVLLYSGDGDMLQCLTDEPGLGGVQQFKPTTKKGVDPLWTAQRIRDEWGLPSPFLVADVKAIAGDSADCYKGAPGIGEVWARRMVAAHGGIESIIKEAEASGEVAGSKSKAKLIITHQDVIRTCHRIALVQRGVRIQIKVGNPNAGELKRVFARLRFHSINTTAKLNQLAIH